MKSPTIAFFNSLGCSIPEQRIAYVANVLRAAMSFSPAISLPATPAKPGKPAVIAQTAKPLRAATAAVPAGSNTQGFGFGELYLDSPAYPAGIPIPAIEEKPATPAILAAPAIPAIPVRSALKIPAIPASPYSPSIDRFPPLIQISMYNSGDRTLPGNIAIYATLPVSTSPQIAGSDLILLTEFTPPTLQPTQWLAAKASDIPDSVVSLPPTLEAYFYELILELKANNPDAVDIYQDYSGVTSRLDFYIKMKTKPGYKLTSPLLELDKILAL